MGFVILFFRFAIIEKICKIDIWILEIVLITILFKEMVMDGLKFQLAIRVKWYKYCYFLKNILFSLFSSKQATVSTRCMKKVEIFFRFWDS